MKQILTLSALVFLLVGQASAQDMIRILDGPLMRGEIIQESPKAVKMIQRSDRYHRSEKPDSNILIVGVPNVGKSSLINVLRSNNLQLKGAP